jgi:hypothetical protein
MSQYEACYRLDDWGSIPGRSKNFCHCIQFGSESRRVSSSLSMCFGAFFPGGKAAGYWNWSLTLIFSKINNLLNYRLLAHSLIGHWLTKSHKGTEQSTIEASITLNGITLTDTWSGDHRMNDLQFAGRYQSMPIRYSGGLISPAKWTLYM